MINIKKYSNRRLYNTDVSSYITQANIIDLIKKNIRFQIVNTEKKDITSSILMQIILEKQTIGTNLIPEELLKKIILFNENNQASSIFNFLNNTLNFANLNGFFSKEFSGKAKLKKFDFEKIFTRPFSNEKFKESKKKKKKKEKAFQSFF
jgi:polyhydroxyalkanoate synthesis repressor PhaR